MSGLATRRIVWSELGPSRVRADVPDNAAIGTDYEERAR
jgi:hypothetical protein